MTTQSHLHECLKRVAKNCPQAALHRAKSRVANKLLDLLAASVAIETPDRAKLRK